MTELERRIENLKTIVAMLKLGTFEQRQKAQSILEEIDRLDHGRKGWVAEAYIIDEHYAHTRRYIKSDLCLSDYPTYYETKEEADNIISHSGLEEGLWHTESKYMEGRK